MIAAALLLVLNLVFAVCFTEFLVTVFVLTCLVFHTKSCLLKASRGTLSKEFTQSPHDELTYHKILTPELALFK